MAKWPDTRVESHPAGPRAPWEGSSPPPVAACAPQSAVSLGSYLSALQATLISHYEHMLITADN